MVSSDVSDVDLRGYLSVPIQPRQSDPFKWWSEEGVKRFPLLCQLARKYLSFPATSVPSERVFSAAGEIVSKKRSRISNENVRTLIFLHANL